MVHQFAQIQAGPVGYCRCHDGGLMRTCKFGTSNSSEILAEPIIFMDPQNHQNWFSVCWPPVTVWKPQVIMFFLTDLHSIWKLNILHYINQLNQELSLVFSITNDSPTCCAIGTPVLPLVFVGHAAGHHGRPARGGCTWPSHLAKAIGHWSTLGLVSLQNEGFLWPSKHHMFFFCVEKQIEEHWIPLIHHHVFLLVNNMLKNGFRSFSELVVASKAVIMAGHALWHAPQCSRCLVHHWISRYIMIDYAK